jgi:hypothetical protein
VSEHSQLVGGEGGGDGEGGDGGENGGEGEAGGDEAGEGIWGGNFPVATPLVSSIQDWKEDTRA